MIIKSFSIVDFKNLEAESFEFKEGNNLIISEDNTQGKSSLIKSIYYTLGFDIRQFPSSWNYKDMYFQLLVDINRIEYKITRQNNIFRVSDVKGTLSVKEYSEWLQNKLEIDLRLVNNKTKQLFNAYSSAVILPFYIDQDDSWDGSPYKNVANSINQYANIPSDIFKSIFSISSLKLLELQNKRNNLTKEKKVVILTIEGLTKAVEEYKNANEDIPEIINFDKDKLRNDIQKYLKIQNDFNDQVVKYKIKLLAKTSEIDRQKQDLSELDELLKMTKSRKSAIQNECKYCHSKLTTEQSLTRLDLSNNEIEISLLKDEIERTVEVLSSEIKEIRYQKETIDNEIKNIRVKLNQSRELLTIEDYVDASAKIQATNELSGLLEKQILLKDTLNNDIKKLDSEIRKIKKETKELEITIMKDYETLVIDMKKIISNLDVDELNFLEFKSIPGSGIDKNKKFLGYYLIYMNLLKKYNTYTIPFCMDSFIKNEISDVSETKMFEAIEKYFFDENYQTFFSIISKNLKNLSFDEGKEYNRIILGDKLLSRGKFDIIRKKFEFES